MKQVKELKPDEQKIYSKISLDHSLVDVRIETWGQKFGTVRQVCNQYGIKYTETNGVVEFSAPKLRMQMLIEKLHFARVYYCKRKLV
jgi:hypothetical protein